MITQISPAGTLGGLNRYVDAIDSKDIDSPEPTERSEFCSTIGDCTPENFVDRVEENAALHGKQNLKLKAYHVVISQTHEEADPRDPQAGLRQHVTARALVKNRFPGHMAKLVTQRDNGKWIETADGQQIWQPGKWHTHAIIANVSEREAVLELGNDDGTSRAVRYRAGRAIDGPMKNIHQIRNGPGGTDALVRQHLGYDNSAYIDACRAASKGRGDRATTKDLAQRADPDRGFSAHDEVRVKLREARSLATSWNDYMDLLGAKAVDVRASGKSGVSYRWVGDDGVEHKARARGKQGLGGDFTRAEIEQQCELNAGAVARGEVLRAPEPELVPAPLSADERPRPVYLTPDGKPPWERDLADYAAQVQRTGGTYESRARVAVDTALDQAIDRDELIEIAADHGVGITDTADAVVARVDLGDGPLAFDLDAERAKRVREIDAIVISVSGTGGDIGVERLNKGDGHDLDDIDISNLEVQHIGRSPTGTDRGPERSDNNDQGAGQTGSRAREQSGNARNGETRSATPIRDAAVEKSARRDRGDDGLSL